MQSVAALEVRMDVRLAWWWPYFYGLVTMVHLTGFEPNRKKFNAHLLHAIRLRINGGRSRRLSDIGK